MALLLQMLPRIETCEIEFTSVDGALVTVDIFFFKLPLIQLSPYLKTMTMLQAEVQVKHFKYYSFLILEN